MSIFTNNHRNRCPHTDAVKNTNELAENMDRNIHLIVHYIVEEMLKRASFSLEGKCEREERGRPNPGS